MATITNIQKSNNPGAVNNMKRSIFLAPQLSQGTILKLVAAYLVMVTVILFVSANPFQSTASLNFNPQTVSASTHNVMVEIPEVVIPAAPYIIVGPGN